MGYEASLLSEEIQMTEVKAADDFHTKGKEPLITQYDTKPEVANLAIWTQSAMEVSGLRQDPLCDLADLEFGHIQEAESQEEDMKSMEASWRTQPSQKTPFIASPREADNSTDWAAFDVKPGGESDSTRLATIPERSSEQVNQTSSQQGEDSEAPSFLGFFKNRSDSDIREEGKEAGGLFGMFRKEEDNSPKRRDSSKFLGIFGKDEEPNQVEGPGKFLGLFGKDEKSPANGQGPNEDGFFSSLFKGDQRQQQQESKPDEHLDVKIPPLSPQSSDSPHSPPPPPPHNPPPAPPAIDPAAANPSTNPFESVVIGASPPVSPQNHSQKLSKLTVAVSEDLACSYVGSSLTSLTIQGSVFISGDYAALRANLCISDPGLQLADITPSSDRIREEDSSIHEGGSRVFGCIFPEERSASGFVQAVKYTMSPTLRPAPLRVQSAVRFAGGRVKLTLQVTANPALQKPLLQLKVLANMVNVKDVRDVKGRPAVKYDGARKLFEWNLPGLNPGQKQLLDVVCVGMPMAEDPGSTGTPVSPRLSPRPEATAPVTVTCHSQDTLFSQLQFELLPKDNGTQITTKVARRFRVAYKTDV